MRKAILRILAFLGLILISCVLINWVIIPNNPSGYQAAKADKLQRLMTTPSPKVVLVGGSNLAFSIDSEQLERELRRPVVNMGLAKSVGLNFLLRETEPYVSKGDLVIISVEYELFYDLYFGTDGFIVELQYRPEGLLYIRSLGEIKTLASKFGPIMQAKFTGYLRKGHSSLEDEIYRRSGFNKQGDLQTHLDEPPALEPRAIFENDVPFQEASIEVLNRFASVISDRGGRVVLANPPLLDSLYSIHKDKILYAHQRLKESLSFPVISEPDDYIFQKSAFFDTAYHLLREGRAVRTERLLRQLEQTGLVDWLDRQ